MNTGRRILIVDDEESLRTILAQLLEDEGHEVTQAKSAEQALDYFNAKPFPLVITDIRMQVSGIDGIELLQKIKKTGEDTQVIMITSYASFETAVTALQAGAYDYLIKPFEDLDLVVKIVNRAIDKFSQVIENRVLIEKLQKNIEELEHSNKSLQDMAIRDGLTGLYNHRYFQENLSVELARSKRHEKTFSLLFLDVDNFKHYNDTHGHAQGDKILLNVAKIINFNVRKSDFVARYGGEEFVVVLPETDIKGAREFAKKICEAISDFPIVGTALQSSGKVTVSIGISTFPDNADNESTLIQYADDALYRAKDKGKNTVV